MGSRRSSAAAQLTHTAAPLPRTTAPPEADAPAEQRLHRYLRAQRRRATARATGRVVLAIVLFTTGVATGLLLHRWAWLLPEVHRLLLQLQSRF